MGRVRSVRANALPEGTEYRDDGCDLAPKCLECPFEYCRYDVPGGVLAFRINDRVLRVLDLRERGLTPAEIAADLQCSRRTVFRHLARGYR